MLFSRLAALLLPCLAAAAPGSASNYFYKGHDLSSLLQLEEGGAIYKDVARNNATRPAEAILGDGGMNAVRLRIWVNPADGINGLNYTLDLAKRFQREGYRLYLDFHFSDSWADPNKQPPPAGWPLDLPSLSTTLRNYVKDTLISFHEAGVQLDLVALGNEIRHGILWPTGYVDVDVQPWSALVQNFTNLATLIKAARAGVSDAVGHGCSQPQILNHLDDGWNVTMQTRWYDAMLQNGVPLDTWDVFGVSFYPFYGTAATFANLRNSFNTLADLYGKPLQVVETDYPAICTGTYNPIPESSEPEIPYSIDGQLTWTEDVLQIVREVPYGLGRGVWYWEPAWLNNTSLGSDCDDAILFGADWSQYPTVIGYSRKSVNLFNQ